LAQNSKSQIIGAAIDFVAERFPPLCELAQVIPRAGCSGAAVAEMAGAFSVRLMIADVGFSENRISVIAITAIGCKPT
jgi:hypothetical protein